MPCNYINKLPFEILQQIFENLSTKGFERQNMKTCLHVCKLWQFMAQGFLNQEYSINLAEDSLKRLLEDVPYFGYKIRSITVNRTADLPDRESNYHTLVKTLTKCPNLVFLDLKVDEIYGYLHALMYGEVKLKNIQIFDADNVRFSSLSTRQLYLQLNLEYHKTITSISINRLIDIPGYTNNNDLTSFVKQFPKLTSLKITGPSASSIDINQLLKSVPRLQEFTLLFFNAINVNSLDEEALNNLEDLDITKLRIEVAEIDVKSLRYIVSRLRKVDNLHLDIGRLIQDVPVIEYGMAQLVNYLDVCITGIAAFHIAFHYQGFNFFMQHNMELRIEPVSEYGPEDDPLEPNHLIEVR
ncbi:hypothetical protein BD770DRAFT_446133 [Pilaira anomala]|nr:hypothetical protein BD770DRAFT_446133 [Pilaira anomala]